jgi:putative lipoic acid-binding regulatory protein
MSPEQSTDPNALNEALWDFPMYCTLKVLGVSQYAIEQITKDILKAHQVSFEQDSVSINWSKNRKYLSVNIRVCFTHAEQVKAVYAALKEHEGIRYAL